MEAELGVFVDGLVVVVGRLGRLPQLEIEVADAIEDRQIGVRVGILFLSFEDFDPRLDGPLGSFPSRPRAFSFCFSSFDMRP